MNELANRIKCVFKKPVSMSVGKALVLLVSMVLLTALFTVSTYQTILLSTRANTPQFLGGWYLESAADTSDETIPSGFDFQSNCKVTIQSSNGEVVTCRYTFSSQDRTITLLNYYGEDIRLGYSIQPLIYFWPISKNGWDADYLFAG